MNDTWITDWPPSARFAHYTRANAGEVLADPVSPLGWTYGWDGGIVAGYKSGLIRCGAYEDADFDPDHPESIACFGGYLYINLAAIRMQGVRNPAATVDAVDTAFFGDHPDVPPYVAHPDDDKPHLTPRVEAHTAWVMTATEWPELDEDRAAAAELRASRGDLTQASDTALLARARDVQSRLPHLFEQHVVSGSSAAIAPGLLGVVEGALGEPGLAMTVLSGLGHVDSADANYALWDLSRIVRDDPALTDAFDAGVDGVLDRIDHAGFTSAWEAFLYEYGSRGPDEWDVAARSWETHPALALAALDRVRLQGDDEAPGLRHEQRVAARGAAVADARRRLADDPDTAALLESAIVAGAMMAHRERTKTTIVRVLHEARMVFRELGRRRADVLGDPDLVFQLLDGELDDFVADPTPFATRLRDRHAQWRELFDLEPPFIIADGNVPPLHSWPRRRDAVAAPAGAGEVLAGVSGCPGVHVGTARVVLDPASPDALEPGDVLVAPCTDPSWTPLFMAAGAVVVDVGGQVSHAVIVSRELGLPCVVSVTDGTQRIADGALVEVDGTAGTVRVIESP